MKLSGYIEGYFGKLLSWGEREEILRQIVDQKLNSYFYCPKEDPFHRLNWKESYPEQTKKRLDEFNSSCKANEIKFFLMIFSKNKVEGIMLRSLIDVMISTRI